jgi:hypothetical protein
VPLVEQELLTLPEQLSSPRILNGVRVALFSMQCFVDRCLSFCPFDHFVVFFGLRILITPLLSSNSPYIIVTI